MLELAEHLQLELVGPQELLELVGLLLELVGPKLLELVGLQQELHLVGRLRHEQGHDLRYLHPPKL